MANGMYRGVASVARKIIKRYINVDGVARSIKNRYRGINGVARQTYASEIYLIQDGECLVDFTATSVWENYPMSSIYKVTEEEDYVEIYNRSFGMGAFITVDGIDLSGYSKIHIECEVSMYSTSANYMNRVALGAYDTADEALGTGSSWKQGDGTIFYRDIYTAGGDASDFVEISKSYDISGYNAIGHIFVYGTSYNTASDYSYVRIKNLWLD